MRIPRASLSGGPAKEFLLRDIPFRRDIELRVRYKDSLLAVKYKPDFICFDDFVLSSTNSPGDIYSMDVRTRKIERWTQTPVARMQIGSLPELIRWKGFDGRLIPGFLYRPDSKFTGKRPVLIDIHGGFKVQ